MSTDAATPEGNDLVRTAEPAEPETDALPPWPPSTFGESTAKLFDLQRQLGLEQEERDLKQTERLALLQERNNAAQERMLPGNERIAEAQRGIAQAQLQMWQMQQPFREKMNENYEESLKKEAKLIDDTFNTMFQQTKWAGYMFWITFLLGAFLVIASVADVMVRPDSNNPLVAAFFGAGALSMLAFFLRDPADKVQRAGGKLVQLQVAMRYHLLETRYWGNYFNNKAMAGLEVSALELSGALSSMRDGMQVIMRQIDESLDDRSDGAVVQRSRRQAEREALAKGGRAPATRRTDPHAATQPAHTPRS